MKILDIIYYRYLDSKGQRMTLGGIQTYITHLADLAVRMGYKTRIFQAADQEFQVGVNEDITVYGVPVSGVKQKDKLISYVLATQEPAHQYVTVFANVDNLMPSMRVPHSICIQHGIGWDRISTGKAPLWLRLLIRTRFAFRLIQSMKRVDEVICVDNNFINWYRAIDSHRDVQLTPIMNFTEIPDTRKTETHQGVSVVFARRFFDYRGTRLFAPAAKQLLQEHPSLSVTFAGEGPDEPYLKEMFRDIPNVTFTQYDSTDSIAFHRQFDIAVVPTTGSEGTSLSLLEAMAAECAVVCTNVGGMTNIVIDGYNGLMVNPDVEELYKALSRLITDADLRTRMAENGFESVKGGFSVAQWESKWSNVLTKHFNKFQ